MAVINKTGLEGKESFLGFWFNGRHSSEFKVIRVSGGKEFEEELLSAAKDTTIDIPGRDGVEFIQAKRQNKQFKISFAFDELYEEDIRAIKQWLAPKKPCELIFDERPYKVWRGKVTTVAKISFVPFDEKEHGVVYKGKGDVTFTCFKPYARSKSRDIIDYQQVTAVEPSQIPFNYLMNIKDWIGSSGIKYQDSISGEGYQYVSNISPTYNGGDLPVAPKITLNITNIENISSNYLQLLYSGQPQIILKKDVLTNIPNGQDGSKKIIIDNEMQLILDANENSSTSNQTRKIYNNAIIAGSFFKLEPGENGGITVDDENVTVESIDFDYLYY